MTNNKKPGSPWWRPIVNGIDQRVTPPANKLVRTNLFADSVAMMTRLEVRLRRRVERQSTWLLHQYNLPAADDIRKMRAQLAALEARIRDMSERLEDQQREAAANGIRESTGQRTSRPARAPRSTKPAKATGSDGGE
jgi:hypothetical protein